MKKNQQFLLDNSYDGLSPEIKGEKMATPLELAERQTAYLRNREILRQQLKQNSNRATNAQSQYFIPGINPGASTEVRLAGGKYSLGADSNVPFVQLEGGGISQKIISWGEMIEVPDGQMVTVKNASFHKGDISLNSGWDYATRPARITIPVGLLNGNTGLPVTAAELAAPPLAFTIVPETPLDCRMARRAYLMVNMVTNLGSVGINIRGENIKHSFPSSTLQSNYTEPFLFPNSTTMGIIPLGSRAFLDPSLPMALTDRVTFDVPLATDYVTFFPIWFYVLEY